MIHSSLSTEDENRRATKSAGGTSNLCIVAQILCTGLCLAVLFSINMNHVPSLNTKSTSAHSVLPSYSPLTFPLPFCLSPLYLPWCKKGSKHPGCHLQLELHLFLSTMTTNVIISVTVVNVAIECPHSLMIQYSLQGTGEFQAEPFTMPAGSGSSDHHCFLSICCHTFSLLA